MHSFRFSQEFSIPKLRDETIYPVKETDWARLKRTVGRMRPPLRFFQFLWPMFSGIFVSSVFFLLTLHISPGPFAPWALPTAWSISVVSVVLALSLFLLDSFQKRVVMESAASVLNEMDEIERRFTQEQETP